MPNSIVDIQLTPFSCHPGSNKKSCAWSWSRMCMCMHTHMHACAGQVHAHTHSYIHSISNLQLLNIMTNAAKSPKQWFQALSQWQPEKIYWNLPYLPQYITSNFPNLSHDKMGELSTYNCKVQHYLYSFTFKTGVCKAESYYIRVNAVFTLNIQTVHRRVMVRVKKNCRVMNWQKTIHSYNLHIMLYKWYQ